MNSLIIQATPQEVVLLQRPETKLVEVDLSVPNGVGYLGEGRRSFPIIYTPKKGEKFRFGTSTENEVDVFFNSSAS